MSKVKEITAVAPAEPKSKIVLDFDKNRFEFDLSMWAERDLHQNKIKELVLSIADVEIEKVDINLNSFEDVFYNLIQNKYEGQNTLNLKPKRLLELLDIDVTSIFIEVSKLQNFHLEKEEVPTEEDYTQSVETEEEEARYEYAQKVIGIIEEYQELTGRAGDLSSFAEAFRFLLEYDTDICKFKARVQFVKL